MQSRWKEVEQCSTPSCANFPLGSFRACRKKFPRGEQLYAAPLSLYRDLCRRREGSSCRYPVLYSVWVFLYIHQGTMMESQNNLSWKKPTRITSPTPGPAQTIQESHSMLESVVQTLLKLWQPLGRWLTHEVFFSPGQADCATGWVGFGVQAA